MQTIKNDCFSTSGTDNFPDGGGGKICACEVTIQVSLLVCVAVEHRKSLGALLARLMSRGSVLSEVWQICADFHLNSSDTLDRMKVLTWRGSGCGQNNVRLDLSQYRDEELLLFCEVEKIELYLCCPLENSPN